MEQKRIPKYYSSRIYFTSTILYFFLVIPFLSIIAFQSITKLIEGSNLSIGGMQDFADSLGVKIDTADLFNEKNIDSLIQKTASLGQKFADTIFSQADQGGVKFTVNGQGSDNVEVF